MSSSRDRNSGLDLLRLILMYMVVVIHVLGHGGILEGAEGITLNYAAYYFLKAIVTCAVDAYALMSGFLSSRREKQQYNKILERWLQVVFYSFGLSLVLEIIGISQFHGIKSLARGVLPVTGRMYWYYTAFFALAMLQPYINRCLNGLNNVRQKKELLIILLILFSIQGVISDPFQANEGFSALWIIVMYIVGYLMRELKIFEAMSCLKLCVIYLLTTIVIWIPIVLFQKTILTSSLSPLIILQGMLLIRLFSNISINNKIVTLISPLSFGVYLFHENYIFRETFITGKFGYLNEGGLVYGIITVLFIAMIIFTCGLLVDYMRNMLFKTFKIHDICKCITWRIDA